MINMQKGKIFDIWLENQNNFTLVHFWWLLWILEAIYYIYIPTHYTDLLKASKPAYKQVFNLLNLDKISVHIKQVLCTY